MNSLRELHQRIIDHNSVIGVIGLGYVGLPVACMFAHSGFQVFGLDIKEDRVARINKGVCPIEGKEPGLAELLAEVVYSGALVATGDYNQFFKSDVVLIDVETPIDEKHIPQYAALRSACSSLGRVMKAGTLVIVESTVAPGTVDRLVRSILEEVSGKKTDLDFYLGTCPERVMPGKLLSNLRKMSRVCGGSTPGVAEVMVSLYRNIVEADLDTADLITAELTKTAENTYRDVNIAFANELAMICDTTGADFLRVRELVNKSPGRNVLMAGAGVGGHCIPKDPWLLAYGAQGKAPLQMIPAARSVNDHMPIYVARMVIDGLYEAGVNIKGARIAVLGFAYLEETDDSRNSPSESLIEFLKQQGAEVIVHDPYINEYKGELIEDLRGCDAAVIMVAHQIYKQLNLSDIKKALRTPVLVDGRRIFNVQEVLTHGLYYLGVGWGK